APEPDRFLESPPISRDDLAGVGPANVVERHEILAAAAVRFVERPERAFQAHEIVAGRDGDGVARAVLVGPRHGRPLGRIRTDDLVHHALHGRGIQGCSGGSGLTQQCRLAIRSGCLELAPALGTPGPRTVSIHRYFRVAARTFDHVRISSRWTTNHYDRARLFPVANKFQT